MKMNDLGSDIILHNFVFKIHLFFISYEIFYPIGNLNFKIKIVKVYSLYSFNVIDASFYCRLDSFH